MFPNSPSRHILVDVYGSTCLTSGGDGVPPSNEGEGVPASSGGDIGRGDSSGGVSPSKASGVCQEETSLMNGLPLSGHQCHSPPSPSSLSPGPLSPPSTPLALARAIVAILTSPGASPGPIPSPGPSPSADPDISAELSYTTTSVKAAQDFVEALHSLQQHKQQQQHHRQQQHEGGKLDGNVDNHDIGNGVGNNGGDGIGYDDAADEKSLLRDINSPLLAFDVGSNKDNDSGWGKDMSSDKHNHKDKQTNSRPPSPTSTSTPTPTLAFTLEQLASIIPQHHIRWLAGNYPDVDMSAFSVEGSFETVIAHVRAYPGTRRTQTPSPALALPPLPPLSRPPSPLPPSPALSRCYSSASLFPFLFFYLLYHRSIPITHSLSQPDLFTHTLTLPIRCTRQCFSQLSD